MAFGDFLAISPAQVLASEAQKRQQDLADQQAAEQSRQFAQTLQARSIEISQARADEQAKALASGAWEKQKFNTEQGWKERTAQWQEGDPARTMALEQYQKELKGKFMPKPNQPGILINPATGEEKLAPVLAETPGQTSQRAIDTAVGTQTGLAPGIAKAEQRKAQQTADIKQKEFDFEEQTRAISAQRNGWVATGLDAQGHTEYGLPEKPLAAGLTPSSQKVGGITYGRPETAGGETPSLQFQKEKYTEQKIQAEKDKEEKKAKTQEDTFLKQTDTIIGDFNKKRFTPAEVSALKERIEKSNEINRRRGSGELEFYEAGGWGPKKNYFMLRVKPSSANQVGRFKVEGQ